MKPDGHRFHKAQLFQRQLRGIQLFSRHHNEFGEGAIPLHAESLVELASIPTATPAGRALTATGVWGDCYVRSRRQYGNASTIFDDGRRYFMAQNARVRDQWIDSAERIQITAAQSHHADFEEHVCISEHGIGDGLEIGLTRLGKQERSHVCTPWKIIGKVIDCQQWKLGTELT